MLLAVSLGSLSGVTLLHFYSAWPPSLLTKISLLGMVLLSVFVINLSSFTLYRKVFIFLLSFCIGWGWAYYQVSRKLQALQSTSCHFSNPLTGQVVGVTQTRGKRIQFDLNVKGCRGWKGRLYWESPTAALQDGDRISVEVKLKTPWSMANPGGFDLEKQLFIENIKATGQVKALISHHPSDALSLSKLRQRIHYQIAKKLGDIPLVGVIQAMTVGIRSGISPKEWQIFQATGTSHVVAISGLHVGLVAMLCGGCTGFFVRRSYFLTSYFPTQCYAALAGMIGAVLYSAAAGFSIPTQRACLMVIFLMIAMLKKYPILSWQTLALAWLGIGFIDPFAPLQMGFWLSFGCVGALVVGNTHFQNSNRLRRWVLPQCVVFIGLLPLGVLFFHQIPIFSPIANFFFIPMVSFIIVPMSLLGALGSDFCLMLAHKALTISWPVLNKLATFELSVLHLPQISTLGMIVSTLGALLLLAPRGVPARHLGWFGLLPIFFTPPISLPEGAFRFTLLDVGQGLAGVIQTKHHSLLYDAGPVYGEYSDAGQRVIRPFLQVFGIHHLDKIIISHSDLDHRGGLNTLHAFPHTDVITSEPEKLRILATRCLPGEQWEWDGVHFMFLNPILQHKKRNNISCVLKVSTKSKSVLLTGDIEEVAEKAILQYDEDALKSDVLLVPHHGSLTSSSLEFIRAVSPTYALFPVGKDNRYGFPRVEILRRYDALGVQNLLAWQTGAIIFQFNHQDELTPPILWRDTFQHYWNQIHPAGERYD